MPRPGHTCRVKKPGDPWHRKQVAVTAVSRTGKACCALWSVLWPALQSPQGSVKRKRVTYRDYMPEELAYVNLDASGTDTAWAPKVGQSYVFVRAGHQWDGCEVTVLSVRKRGFEVSRCCSLCDWIFDTSMRTRKPPTWVATADELC